MLALVTVLAVVALSLLITRVATIALETTGLSREAARFQARSALSGTGFTTDEAESVVNHPVRRRIVMALMLLGSAGLVTAIASLIVSFGGAEADERVRRGGVLAAGLILVWLLSRSRYVDRRLARLVSRFLRARGLYARDYASLLELSGGYAVHELLVEEGDWLADCRLGDLRLRDEGVVVLGVHRGRDYIGVPGAETRLEPGDRLLLYAHRSRLDELDRRSRGPLGDRAHREAAAEQAEAAEHHAGAAAPSDGQRGDRSPSGR